MEQEWGDFRYTVYLLSGMLGTVLACLLTGALQKLQERMNTETGTEGSTAEDLANEMQLQESLNVDVYKRQLHRPAERLHRRCLPGTAGWHVP